MKDIEFLKYSLIIHRGKYNSKLVENTLPSFVKCMDKNYMIELDIHMLNDGNIVVYHDYNLLRLCGVNKIIESQNIKDLKTIKIKNKYSIPTLSQVINIIDGKVPLLIEIKDLDSNSKFEEEIVKILDNYKGKFAIQSMNPFVIDWFYKYRKEYTIGIIVFNELNLKLLKKYLRKVDFISINKKYLPLDIKKFTIGWTIKDSKQYTKYKKLCDNLICENIL